MIVRACEFILSLLLQLLRGDLKLLLNLSLAAGIVILLFLLLGSLPWYVEPPFCELDAVSASRASDQATLTHVLSQDVRRHPLA